MCCMMLWFHSCCRFPHTFMYDTHSLPDTGPAVRSSPGILLRLLGSPSACLAYVFDAIQDIR